MAKIAIMGYGVVGTGVVEVLTSHSNSICKKSNEQIEVKYILDLKDFKDSRFKFTKNFNDILNDEEISIVVETMGGIFPAFDYVSKLLNAKKSVVTSNKELVAEKGYELLKIAKEQNVNFLFEASVGGGIPIIRPLNQCLAANDVVEIAGILNGTSNFILTKMIKDHMKFENALKLSQELGYAEKDPKADIQGVDACRKICILASLVYGKHVYPKYVNTKGITEITLEDVEYADALGGVIKLIARVRSLEGKRIEIYVEPMIIAHDSPLSTVDDVFNAILVKGDATGDVVFYGKGAGKLPTASAVVADIIDCVKHKDSRKYLYWEREENNYVSNYNNVKASFYLRIKSLDIISSMKSIEDAFGKVKVVYRRNFNEYDFAIVTPIMEISKINELIKNISDEDTIIVSNIMICGL